MGRGRTRLDVNVGTSSLSVVGAEAADPSMSTSVIKILAGGAFRRPTSLEGVVVVVVSNDGFSDLPRVDDRGNRF